MSMTTAAPPAPLCTSARARFLVLRANALYLLVASVAGFLFLDIAGIFFASGPARPVFATAQYVGIGFIEAHGLAFIIGVLLWRAEPQRSWHLTGAAVGVLLGTCNLVFWQIFVATDSLWMGYLTTTLHWTFAVLQSIAAVTAKADSAKSDSTRSV